MPGASEQAANQAAAPAGDAAAADCPGAGVPVASGREGCARRRRWAGDRRWAPGAWPGVSGGAGLIGLAVLTDAGAGVGAVAFRYLILGVSYAVSGHRDYSVVGGAANPLVAGLGGWFVLFAPVVGGLAYGPLLSRFAPQARGHGVPEVMYAVDRLGGRMRPRVPLIKALASALCIGSGGSVGREGPIVQIGSALGSVAGQLAGVPERQLPSPGRRDGRGVELAGG